MNRIAAITAAALALALAGASVPIVAAAPAPPPSFEKYAQYLNSPAHKAKCAKLAAEQQKAQREIANGQRKEAIAQRTVAKQANMEAKGRGRPGKLDRAQRQQDKGAALVAKGQALENQYRALHC